MATINEIKSGKQYTTEDRRIQEQSWRKVLQQQQQSGLSQTSFCRQNSISLHRFTYWKRQIAIRDGKRENPRKKKKSNELGVQKEPSLVPIQISSGTQLSSSFPGNAFEVILANDRIIRIPPRFDEKALIRLVSIMEKPC